MPFESYAYETEPYQHQRDVFRESWEREAYALFLDMGTGKTKVVLDTAALLFEAGKIDGLLVVAPKGVYRNWVGEIETHLPGRVSRVIGIWSPERTKAKTRELRRLCLQDCEPGLKILLMNVEAFSSSRGQDAAQKFLVSRAAMMVVDESTAIKNLKAERTKAMIRVGQSAIYRRILTGSPITQSPCDLYSQCFFLGSELLGFKSFYAFRGRYAVTQSMRFGNKRRFTKVVGYQRLDELTEKLESFSTRVTKEECLDLPPKVYQRREVELSREQEKVYRAMSENAEAVLEDGTASALQVITQILRLHQIACGFVKTDEGQELDIPSHRIEALLEVLDETSGKAIVWATYRHNITEIANALRERYGARSIAVYYGGTSADERVVAVERFQNDPECRWFVGNPQTGGYGLTLTAASTVVYYSNSYQLEVRLQSEDRAHRIGQQQSVTYVDLVAPGTVDERIVQALRGKRQLADLVMGEAWREWI